MHVLVESLSLGSTVEAELDQNVLNSVRGVTLVEFKDIAWVED